MSSMSRRRRWPKNASRRRPEARETPMLIGQREALREIAPYVRSSTATGLAFFLYDFGLYWAVIAGVLFLPVLWLKVLAANVAGLTLVSIKTLGQDADQGCPVNDKSLY